MPELAKSLTFNPTTGSIQVDGQEFPLIVEERVEIDG